MRRLLATALLLAGVGHAASASTLSFTGPTASFIDKNTLQDFSFNVDAQGSIANLDVSIATSGPFADDVTFFISHLGVTVQLYTGHGDTSSSVINATFSDAATVSAPYHDSASGLLRPAAPLSAFDGLDAGGTYTISTIDNVFAGDGTNLAASSITLTTNVPEPTSLAMLGIGLCGAGAFRRRGTRIGRAARGTTA